MQGVIDQGARRLKVAFELFELAEAVLRQSVRRENPGAGPDEIERRIAAWRRRRPESGDSDSALRAHPGP